MCFIGERRKSQGYDFQGNKFQVIWCHSSPRHFLSVGSAESVLTSPWSLRGLWGQSEGRDQQELACTTEGCLPAWAAGPLRPLSFWLRYFGHVQAHSRETASHSLLANQLHPEKGLIQRSEHRRQVPLLYSVPTHTHTRAENTHCTHVQTAYTCAHNTHNTHVCAHKCRQHTCTQYTRIQHTHHTRVHTQKHTCPHVHTTHNTRVHMTHTTYMCTQHTRTKHTCAHNTHVQTTCHTHVHITPHTCIQHRRVCTQV